MNKYRAIRTEYNGRMFDSKKEASVARFLDLCKQAKNPKDKVLNIEYQVPYEIVVNGKKICKYYPDFIVDYADGKKEVIDVKSKATKTPVYNLKKKLMKAVHDIDIVEM